MEIKKILLPLAGAAALSLLDACGDDSSSGPAEDASSSSQEVVYSYSQNEDGTLTPVPVSSSSVQQTVHISSSVTDADYPQMVCSEIMYNAADGSPLEWVEIGIRGGADMKTMTEYGLRLSGAVTYDFPAEPLKKNEYVVVTNDLAAFAAAYPNFTGRVFGPWEGKLPNEGDVVDVRLTGTGDVSCAFSKEPPWPSLADGKGHTLVYRFDGIQSQASSWAASKVPGGTPGVAPDEYIVPSKVRLNEIKPFVLGESNSWVELYNAGAEPVDVTGWIFESVVKAKSWTIQGGIVPAGGYLVLDLSDPVVLGDSVFLSANGGEYYLYETVGGERTGAESSLMLAASSKSSGVVDVSDGSISQGALAVETPGAKNSALKVGPLFINEIYYHPAEGGFEFMEIVNKSEAAVALSTTKGANGKGWKVEGINFEFPIGTVIGPGELVVLLPDSLKASEAGIRAGNGVASSVKFFYYSGKLSNRGETIAIKEPFDMMSKADGTIQWYYDWADATLYSDSWAGYESADGKGSSLQRVDFSSMGYEASAWKAAKPTFAK